VALAYSTVSGDLLGPVVRVEPVRAIPYLGSALVSLGDALALVLLIALAAARSPFRAISQAGLQASIRRPALWALLWLAPAFAACLVFARIAPDVRGQDIAWLGIGGPLAEEFVYRGLALGVLIRWCGWPIWLACVWPAVFFGAAHFGQGEDWSSVAGIVAITGLGGILFGWLFVRWRFNLWPPVFLHVGLNTIWLVFDLGENALGGWLGNAMRLAVIAVAVGASLWLAPARERKATS
jgi:membrane protease YdiL (CAAX protease family)